MCRDDETPREIPKSERVCGCAARAIDRSISPDTTDMRAALETYGYDPMQRLAVGLFGTDDLGRDALALRKKFLGGLVLLGLGLARR